MVAVETQEYLLDPAQFMKAAYRTYWSNLWRLSAMSVVAAPILVIVGFPSLAAADVLISLAVPFAVAKVKSTRALSSPLNKLPYVMRFDTDHMEQISAGDRRGLIRYAELSSIDEIPEGLRVWVLKNGSWFLIPRHAFATSKDFEDTCALLIAAGAMKSRTRR